jgi:hypothetical protein
MSHLRPKRETRDNEGYTSHFNGVVGTTPISIPASPVADEIISEIMIKAGNNSFKILFISFDNGASWFDLQTNGALGWTPKGNVTQVKIKGSDADTLYQILLNREVV